MVKIFSSKESGQLSEAIAAAEKRTSAEIAAVVIPISDRYIAEMMFYGFLIGSLAAFIFWQLAWVRAFPMLFLIQLLSIFSLPFIPYITPVFLHCLPKKLLFHRAAHIGAEELLAIQQTLPHDTPVVLLFISLAERYVHLFTNPVVKSKIDDRKWDALVAKFTTKLKTQDLTSTCVEAAQAIGDILESVFPDNGGKNYYKDKVPYR